MKDMVGILKQQEEKLIFDHFTNTDAWKLGCFLMDCMEKEQLKAALLIRQTGGYTLFQAGPEGTDLLNQIWADKKFETVRIFGKSSLRCWFEADETGQTLKDHGLEDQCAFAPGAFPIRVKGAGMTAVVSISGLPGLQDHTFLTRALSDWLGAEDVPELPDRS